MIVWGEIQEGLYLVLRGRLLRPLAVSVSAYNFVEQSTGGNGVQRGAVVGAADEDVVHPTAQLKFPVSDLTGSRQSLAGGALSTPTIPQRV